MKRHRWVSLGVDHLDAWIGAAADDDVADSDALAADHRRKRVARAAQLLGISRAAAYRLVNSGELPVRRLGGRVYVVTSGLREIAS